MWRSLAALALGGCLWIGPDAHDARKAKMAIDFAIDDLAPEAWSVCVDEPPRFVLTGTVSAIHGGAAFQGWFQVEGDRRRELGEVRASAAADGRAEVSFTLDLTDTLAALPACAGACETRIRVGLSRIGLEDEEEATVLLIGDQEPDLVGADLLDPAGGRLALDGIALSANPADSVSAALYPEIAFEMADPHLPVGLGGGGRVAYCPDGVDPLADPAACVIVSAASDPDALAHGGDMTFRAPTAELGLASCTPETRDVRWRLWGLVDEHVCGGPIARELTTAPLRLVAADCDGDGAPAPDDCADDDPDRFPGQQEVWYDGVDADCSGGSDFDQDQDGADGPSETGPDCDDLNGEVGPGRPDVCDTFDNDCDGSEPTDAVTVFSVAGATNHTGPNALADALADAVAGDDVAICPGTYTGNFVVAVDGTVRSGTGNAADVAIVGATGAPALTVDAATVTLRGLTIRNGPDGGVEALDATTLTIEDCELRDNDATRGGGLLAAGTVTLRRTAITGNGAVEGGGIAVEPGTVLVLEDGVSITTNTATSGAGLHLADATVTLDDTVLIGSNTASGDGGGVFASGSLTWDGGTVEANLAVNGGGFHLEAGAKKTVWSLADVTVQDHFGPSLTDGAGIHASGAGALELTRVELLRNDAGGNGGGLFAGSTGEPIDVTLTNCTIADNLAASEGGGVAIENGALLAKNGEISGNSADYGAGVHGRGATLTLGEGIAGVDVLGNVADRQGGGVRLVSGLGGLPPLLETVNSDFEDNLADYGGAIFLDPDAPDTMHAIEGGTLAGNEAAYDGGALYVDDGTVRLTGSVSVSGNLPNGARLIDERVEACTGVQVDDPISNGTLDQGADSDCFEVTTTTVSTTCGC